MRCDDAGRGMRGARRGRRALQPRHFPVAVVWAALAALTPLGPVGPVGPVGPAGAAAAGSEDGKALFETSCRGCHTIGGGRSVGPDLQGLADRRERAWVEQFIIAPDKVIASGDPIAKSLVEDYGTEMPNLGVTSEQVGPLLEFLGFEATPGTTTGTTPAPATPPLPPAPSGADEELGKNLFTGSDRFDAGGPSCLSCHSVAGVGTLGGGKLGPDLTGAFAKFGGAQGLDSVLRTTPFPTMAPIFSRKALTAAERASLVAFLASAPDRQRPRSAAGKLVGFSTAAAALLVLLGLGIWRHRLTGVRKPLVNRSTRK